MNRIAFHNILTLFAFSAIAATLAVACGSPSYSVPSSQETTPGTGSVGHAGNKYSGGATAAGGYGGVWSAGTAGGPSGEAGVSAGGPVGPTACYSDAECSGLHASRVCDTANGLCVECLPGKTTCGAGLYCGTDKECHVGCSANADCITGNCGTAQHQCLGCQTNVDCAVGTHCDTATATCVASCDSTAGCPTGWTCCAGACVNLDLDEANCGSCATSCARPNASVQCGEATCFILGCNQGYDNCNDKAMDGCEADLLGKSSHCGSCDNQCTSPLLCKAGVCAPPDCSQGYYDCDGDLNNGCETNIARDVLSCGSCHIPCSTANGTPSCDGGLCAMTCNSGWGDCDANPNNGCEAEFKTNISHCGRCGAPCTNTHGDTACTDSKCTPSCITGYGDCDGIPANGCETDVLADINNCGICGKACVLPHATSTCSTGKCSIVTCATGWDDCNGKPEDGCEVNLLEDSSHCGTCDKVCSKVNGTATCSQGKCAISCTTNYGNCDESTLPNNGCETDLTKTVAHCGKCETGCTDKTNGTATCVASTCGVSCKAGYGDCNTNIADGCETDILNSTGSTQHCGGCNKPCATACVNGACATPCTGLCTSPVPLPRLGQTIYPGSNAFCYETASSLSGGTCNNFAAGRVPYVNSTQMTCASGNNTWLASLPMNYGGYCIHGIAGGDADDAFNVWP